MDDEETPGFSGFFAVLGGLVRPEAVAVREGALVRVGTISPAFGVRDGRHPPLFGGSLARLRWKVARFGRIDRSNREFSSWLDACLCVRHSRLVNGYLPT
jgi:hypothetical protein